jgi:hypothetical protein
MWFIRIVNLALLITNVGIFVSYINLVHDMSTIKSYNNLLREHVNLTHLHSI